jgi:non-ribosomal peptide synthetase component E (peptide arylation enzyme)
MNKKALVGLKPERLTCRSLDQAVALFRIIRGGFNVSAQEVGNMVLGHPKVPDATAVAMPDEILGELTCIYVVPRPGETVALSEIVDYMKEKGIAVYKIPERLEIVVAIPRNPVGKILKKTLREDIRMKLGAMG